MTDRTFQLYRGETLLGVLTPTESDQPWWLGSFAPTIAFEEVRPLFLQELKLLNADQMGEWELLQTQIQTLELKLVPSDGSDSVSDFLLHIDAENAWWRY